MYGPRLYHSLTLPGLIGNFERSVKSGRGYILSAFLLMEEYITFTPGFLRLMKRLVRKARKELPERELRKIHILERFCKEFVRNLENILSRYEGPVDKIDPGETGTLFCMNGIIRSHMLNYQRTLNSYLEGRGENLLPSIRLGVRYPGGGLVLGFREEMKTREYLDPETAGKYLLHQSGIVSLLETSTDHAIREKESGEKDLLVWHSSQIYIRSREEELRLFREIYKNLLHQYLARGQFRNAYYLVADKGGDEVYTLLKDAGCVPRETGLILSYHQSPEVIGDLLIEIMDSGGLDRLEWVREVIAFLNPEELEREVPGTGALVLIYLFTRAPEHYKYLVEDVLIHRSDRELILFEVYERMIYQLLQQDHYHDHPGIRESLGLDLSMEGTRGDRIRAALTQYNTALTHRLIKEEGGLTWIHQAMDSRNYYLAAALLFTSAGDPLESYRKKVCHFSLRDTAVLVPFFGYRNTGLFLNLLWQMCSEKGAVARWSLGLMEALEEEPLLALVSYMVTGEEGRLVKTKETLEEIFLFFLYETGPGGSSLDWIARGELLIDLLHALDKKFKAGRDFYKTHRLLEWDPGVPRGRKSRRMYYLGQVRKEESPEIIRNALWELDDDLLRVMPQLLQLMDFSVRGKLIRGHLLRLGKRELPRLLGEILKRRQLTSGEEQLLSTLGQEDLEGYLRSWGEAFLPGKLSGGEKGFLVKTLENSGTGLGILFAYFLEHLSIEEQELIFLFHKTKRWLNFVFNLPRKRELAPAVHLGLCRLVSREDMEQGAFMLYAYLKRGLDMGGLEDFAWLCRRRQLAGLAAGFLSDRNIPAAFKLRIFPVLKEQEPSKGIGLLINLVEDKNISLNFRLEGARMLMLWGEGARVIPVLYAIATSDPYEEWERLPRDAYRLNLEAVESLRSLDKDRALNALLWSGVKMKRNWLSRPRKYTEVKNVFRDALLELAVAHQAVIPLYRYLSNCPGGGEDREMVDAFILFCVKQKNIELLGKGIFYLSRRIEINLAVEKILELCREKSHLPLLLTLSLYEEVDPHLRARALELRLAGMKKKQ